MTDEMNKETGEQAETPIEETENKTEAAETDSREKDPKKKVRRLEVEVADLTAKLAGKEKELAEKNDQCLRIAAEYENFRKRSAKEREGIFTDAYAEALAALFPVVDNLERAAKYSGGETVAEGLALTLKSVGETLEKLGVTEIEAEGKPFDPELHNAVMHIEDESLGENVVVEVLQKGYRRGERVLRYAMVKVAN